jgi:ABC-type dipeptide/oligopeptide/nickel transport system ATPase subunit
MPNRSAEPARAAPIIAVHGLEVTFGHGEDAVRAVRGIDFSVNEGTSFGLVGESGSGKSTVLRAISGLNPHWAGRIAVAGEPQGARRPRSFHKLCQMVFQDPYGSLHPRHTVDRILAEPVAIHGLGDVDGRVERMLGTVGLGPEFRFRYPHQLSGGQRQRVAIARALILEPRILLLDEPTSALDVSVQAEILNLLHRLRTERGLTYLLVSHNLAVISYMCDRLAVMNRGRIVEEMTVAQLREGRPSEGYTRQLLRASEGYDRAVADSFETFA